MTSEPWQRVERLYHAALARPAEERAVFLRDACAGDEALHREVESLLAQASAASGFLNGLAVEAAATLTTDVSGTWLGRQIGVYREYRRRWVAPGLQPWRSRSTRRCLWRVRSTRRVSLRSLPSEDVRNARR